MNVFSIVVLLAFLSVAYPDIIPYKDDIIYPQHPAYLSVPKFAPKDAPHWAPGNGNSFIGKIDFPVCVCVYIEKIIQRKLHFVCAYMCANCLLCV